ncbi:uncharacterized protein KNAG_0A05220 [Huiozyma naganishii CBS 8797]|uniref:Nodulin-like domain-containing protein n=1 Tax=Huiozyma naganishii (strain ATCC MYA-139 / BCRC 22969 / CBS 8797 / KCTC 17520 / NBRC 10181 / NCYC 3082 / Yp74L-3) TaxID=1071383 RepID=J7RF48_HUIN7|nr:hypothetical protein KNAG_0A05220 [Kazachstania naganishii CBS 8797]CCK68188.1 hypothetical protein KNAG_0A05220 [Kazachstania naganishii CBS 8797]
MVRSPPPSLLWKSFIGSNIVALGAGTPYLYSYYAPQLLSRCNIPIKQSSNIALSINIGSALLGAVAGMVVDISPKLSCLIGSVCTFFAYLILYICYRYMLSKVLLVSFALVLVGFGSVSGFYAAMKVCTANFPNRRGTAAAFPVSLYGLSGLLFSFLCSRLFKDKTAATFLFLLVACSSMIFGGVFTLNIWDFEFGNRKHLGQLSSVKSGEDENTVLGTVTTGLLLSPTKSDGSDRIEVTPSDLNVITDRQSPIGNSLTKNISRTFSIARLFSLSTYRSNTKLHYHAETPPSRKNYSTVREGRSTSFEQQSIELQSLDQEYQETERNEDYKYSSSVDKPVWDCIKSPIFIAYCIIVATLQGIGQTYIYSVGFILQAQINSMGYKLPPNFNATKLQASHVALISFASFLGRLSSGPISDMLVKRYNSQRLWNIFSASLLFAFGAMKVSEAPPIAQQNGAGFDLQELYFSSIFFGYAFGIMFGTFPSIVADTFGTSSFSTLWGIITTGGLPSVKLFSTILASDLTLNTAAGDTICKVGVECYAHTFRVIEGFALFAAFITSTLILMNYLKNKQERRQP